MKIKKRITALLLSFCALFGALFAFAGCNNSDEKTEITMYLWDKSMTKTLTPWLEKQFPEYKLTFVVGYNTMAYYTDLTQRGEAMPDIITCRRFSINDAAHMSDQLLNLSSTEIVGTFYSSYIENNRETDGGIRWLPMCAEVDGYIANLDLFEKHNVKVPTNYSEFIEAINAFEALGIRGFSTDWRSDYTCLELLQGNSIPLLMSREGANWRMQYESETDENPVGLDKAVWPQVFERFEKYIEDVKYDESEINNRFVNVTTPFFANELAIMRGTANDCVYANNTMGMNCVMLPYFGETEEDNWVLTYPICQLAVAKHVGESPAKKQAVLRVLSAIFSEEGQGKLSAGSSVLSYNQEVSIEMGKPLEKIMGCIESNHLYMRLASTEFFSISKNVVHKMLNGVDGDGKFYGAEEAYADFNSQLTDVKQAAEEEIVLSQKTAYDYAFGEHGSPAASSLMNTMRRGAVDDEGNCDDIAIGYSSVVSSPVFAGEYTEQQLKWLMTFKTVAYRGEYTGAEIRRIMEWLINVKEDGSNPIRHYNNMPVTSGMEYTVKGNGDGTYTLLDITINGASIEDAKTYRVLLLGDDDYIESSVYCNCPMPADLKAKRKEQNVGDYNSYDSMFDGVAAAGQLLAPTPYVTFAK
ncbi:MAG: 5'-nucleotidase C-terminal domain-containing protein [Candidatus Coproplasma sp.]